MVVEGNILEIVGKLPAPFSTGRKVLREAAEFRVFRGGVVDAVREPPNLIICRGERGCHALAYRA